MGVLDSLLASSVISCARMCVCVCVRARACIHTQVTRRGRATGTREWHRQSSQKSAGREAAAAVRVVSAGDLIIRHVQLLDRDARVASLHSSRAHGRRPEQHQKAPAYCPTHPTSRRAPPRSPQTWSARSSSAASGQRQVAMRERSSKTGSDTLARRQRARTRRRRAGAQTQCRAPGWRQLRAQWA